MRRRCDRAATDDPAAKRARWCGIRHDGVGSTVVVNRVVGAAGLEMPLEAHLIQACCGRSMSMLVAAPRLCLGW